MTKAELIDRIARSRDLPPDISKKLIGQVLGLAFDELASYFARARVTRTQSPRFTFPRFGTFTKKRRSARRGVNPRTLEPITIEACDTIDFKASRELREAMNPDGAAETTRPRAKVGPAKKKSSAKKKSTKKKTSRKASESPSRARGPGKRRLTPRDEETEVPTSIGEALFDPKAKTKTKAKAKVELPASPMQRVKGRGRAGSRGTG
ncbi:MAG: HU family DNA-binding protein [Myxococcota bacterium]